MDKHILIAILTMTVIIGFGVIIMDYYIQNVYTGKVETEITKIEETKKTCHLYGEEGWVSSDRQKVRVKIINPENFQDSGVCYSLLYLPDEETDYIKGMYRNWYPNDTEFAGILLHNVNGESNLRIFRGSDKDKIQVVYEDGTIEERYLSCQEVQSFEFRKPEFRERTYNCIFDGKIKLSNKTYEELIGLPCDSYETFCDVRL